VARHWQTKEFHFSSQFLSNFQVRGAILMPKRDSDEVARVERNFSSKRGVLWVLS